MKKQSLKLEDVRESFSKLKKLEKNELRKITGGKYPVDFVGGAETTGLR
jgi:bacteriocin-like protein